MAERGEMGEGRNEVVGEREGGGVGDEMGEEGKKGAWPFHAVITLWRNERGVSWFRGFDGERGGVRRRRQELVEWGSRRREVVAAVPNAGVLFDRRLFIGNASSTVPLSVARCFFFFPSQK